MDKLLFFPKLAIRNFGTNHKTYVPYLFTCIVTIMMYYMIHTLSINPGLLEMPGSSSLIMMMQFGTGVIATFSFIFLFYTNSFLTKRRKKEFGLYQVLGMEKKHLAMMLACETLLTAMVGLILGLLGGILLSKLMYLALLRIVDAPVPLAFGIPVDSIGVTVGLFSKIFLAILLWTFWCLRGTKPIQLIQGGQVGEKEPKTRWIMAILGTLCLGIGYGIALTVRSPLEAIMLFFLAVLLVIFGTYLLFTSVSIAVLKWLRAQKSFYYHPRHFTNIAGMLYRMKQNAVGLANICILSTMVLVALSTTASLYFGRQDILDNRFPRDYNITCINIAAAQSERLQALFQQMSEDAGQSLENLECYRYMSGMMAAQIEDDRFSTNAQDLQALESGIYGGTQFYAIEMVVLDTWNLAPPAVSLADDEVLLQASGCSYDQDTVTIDGQTFRIAGRVDSFQTDTITPTLTLLVANEDILTSFLEKGSQMQWQFVFDLPDGSDEQIDFARSLQSAAKALGIETVRCDIRSEWAKQDKAFTGGFFFIGLFLGGLFLLATVLIIYYKQITEGYEDQNRFAILQKVGMSLQEVRATIRTQILMVFFLPLAVAVVHVAVAFPLVQKLLVLFALHNVTLFVVTNGVTILLFVLIYALVFALTAREYYKIVKNMENCAS